MGWPRWPSPWPTTERPPTGSAPPRLMKPRLTKESAMPSEDDLRKEFHDNEPGGAIDLDAVLRRSRARRRPRVAAAAIGSTLAVVGIVVPVSISLASTGTVTSVLDAGAATAPHSTAGPVRLGGENTN